MQPIDDMQKRISELESIVKGFTSREEIKMIKNQDDAERVLPAWFLRRMMADEWLFALQLSNGSSVAITRINAISSDGKWIDVEMATNMKLPYDSVFKYIPVVDKERTEASIQVSHVVLALDIQGS